MLQCAVLVREDSVVVALTPDLAVGSYRRALASGVDGLRDANLPPEMIARRHATARGEGATAMLSDEERGRLQNAGVKLGARSRPEAIQRATQLGMID